jgi:ketosteroid isomerase-like protein
MKTLMNRRNVLATGVAAISAAAVATAGAKTPAEANPELEKIVALLTAHDKAMTNHDFDGVMATLAKKAAVMGTGPGEMWTGKEEIKDAYKHFFEVFDKGEQKFEYLFKEGNLSSEMGWLVTSGNVTGKKDGKKFSYPMNLSLTVTKEGSDWKISSMHYSIQATKPTPTK